MIAVYIMLVAAVAACNIKINVLRQNELTLPRPATSHWHLYQAGGVSGLITLCFMMLEPKRGSSPPGSIESDAG